MRSERGRGARWAARIPAAALVLWWVGCGSEAPVPPPAGATRSVRTHVARARGSRRPSPFLPSRLPRHAARRIALRARAASRVASPTATPPAPEPWAHQRGGPQDDTGMGVAVDGEGHVSWVWTSTPREDQDRDPVEGQRRALTLSRYTRTGEHEWTREFPRVRISEPRVGACERWSGVPGRQRVPAPGGLRAGRRGGRLPGALLLGGRGPVAAARGPESPRARGGSLRRGERLR